jgi:hypothetical protein
MKNQRIDPFAKYFSKYGTAFCLTKALLEDYVKVVARLENCAPEQIQDRIDNRSAELFEEIKAIVCELVKQ